MRVKSAVVGSLEGGMVGGQGVRVFLGMQLGGRKSFNHVSYENGHVSFRRISPCRSMVHETFPKGLRASGRYFILPVLRRHFKICLCLTTKVGPS